MAESLPKLVRSERDGDTPSRTSGKQAAERYRLGDLIVDVGGGAVTRGDEALALHAGCDGYLAKPIDTRTFAAKVTAFIAAANSRHTEPQAA